LSCDKSLAEVFLRSAWLEAVLPLTLDSEDAVRARLADEAAALFLAPITAAQCTAKLQATNILIF
jgi:hypothetical protein